MARKPKPKPQPEPAKSFDEFAEEIEAVDEDVASVEPEPVMPAAKARDWRDVERYKEERELRRLVDDDLDLDFDDRKPRRR